MQQNSGNQPNRILKISMITVAVITCLFAVLKVANIFDVTKAVSKTVAFVKKELKLGADTESDATIQNININGIDYALEDNKYNYDITLPETTDKLVVISATKKDVGQVITGDGDFLLNDEGKCSTKITVKSADGVNTLEYTINLTKPSTSKLKSLEIAGVRISPEFNPDITTYTAKVVSTVINLHISATAYDNDSTVTITGGNNLVAGDNTVSITVSNPKASSNKVYSVIVNSAETQADEYTSTGSAQEYLPLGNGTYMLEVWGAQGGGNHLYSGHDLGIAGNGGYSRGTLKLKKDTKLYVYVGGAGSYSDTSYQVINGGFNGGGTGVCYQGGTSNPGASGGGATDIRLIGGEWNDSTSLLSRFIVAGGGGRWW